jgi:hypothetical protein
VVFGDTAGHVPPSIVAPGLRAVVVILGRESDEAILAEMRRLLDLLSPGEPLATRGDGWSPRSYSVVYGNRVWWRSKHGTYRLTAQVMASGDTWSHFRGVGWQGVLDVEQRAEVAPDPEWSLEGGRAVPVVGESLYDDEPPDRTFHFSYLSECLPQTDECLAEEIRELWPQLRERAEAERATKIFLRADNGFWFGKAGDLFSLEPSPDAEEGWEGFPAPVSPGDSADGPPGGP